MERPMARYKIKQDILLVGSARLAPFYVSTVAVLPKGDPARIGYDELKRRVFDCEFDDRGGETPETSIIIHGAASHDVGVLAEYVFLSHEFGDHGRDWSLESQAVGESNERRWDRMVVKLLDGSTTTRYFDITEFCSKW
jgi:hypothetical protein